MAKYDSQPMSRYGLGSVLFIPIESLCSTTAMIANTTVYEVPMT